MASTYGNILMLGIPMALTQFGAEASSTIAMVVLVHSPVLFAVAAIHAAMSPVTQAGGLVLAGGVTSHVQPSLLFKLAEVVQDLARNPIILAILLGVGFRAADFPLPALADHGLTVLGQGTLPCVLIALGVGLSTFELKGRIGVVLAIVGLKLIVLPGLVWWVGTVMLQLDAATVGVVAFLSAMPVGANALAFAEGGGEGADYVAGAVALSTVLSPITLIAVLWLLGQAAGT